ncbi:MAG: hypothetical protein ACPGD5_01985 [Salibacteraceae bacterium]
MRLAKILSYITHPILITTYLLAFVLYQKNSYLFYTITPSGRLFFMGISIVLTIVAPLISVAYLVYQKQVTNFYLDHRKERIVPMAITVAYTFGLYYLLQKFSLPPLVMSVVGVGVIGVALTLIITLFWKISAHMMGIGGFTGAVLALSTDVLPASPEIILGLFVLSGLVGTARIKQDSHTLTQVIVGWALGFLVSYGVAIFLS